MMQCMVPNSARNIYVGAAPGCPVQLSGVSTFLISQLALHAFGCAHLCIRSFTAVKERTLGSIQTNLNLEGGPSMSKF